MKKFVIVLAIIIQSVLSVSQAPKGFSYQAILRNSDGTVKANETVALQISIVDEMGASAYLEVHNTQTNQLGLVNVIIGEGTTSDDLSMVDWSTGPYFIDITVNGVSMGSSPILSVPYALYAESASTFTETDPIFSDWDKSSGISITENQIINFGTYIITETQSLADVAELNNSVNSQIKNLTDPTDDQDAATKAYVDELKETIINEFLDAGLNGFVKDIDGNVYKTIKIGNQVWMAENIATTKFNDGANIPLVADPAWANLSTPGYRWYNNDAAIFQNTYGALYNWYTVNAGNLCPTGWHIPSDSEWTVLTDYLGGESVAGGKLKETDTIHWNSPNIGATNETGFTALPAGIATFIGGFQGIGDFCYFWSSSMFDANISWARGFYKHDSTVGRASFSNKMGNSVRCVKD